MKTVINYLLLLLSSCNLGSSSEKEIQSNANNFMDTITVVEVENPPLWNDFGEEIDIDSIIFLIENTQNDISSFDNLRENVEFNDLIKIYTYDWTIDGTRAVVHFPIIQWKNNQGVLHAKNLSKYVECEFSKIISLNAEKGLFLLFGRSKADGACHSNYAYVIQIRDNKIDLEYPAFGSRPYLNFCNGKYQYDEDEKLLSFQLNTITNKESFEDLFNQPDKYGKFSNDSITAKKIYRKLSGEYFNSGYFNLEFNDTIFLID